MVEYTTLPYPSIYLFKPSVLPYLIPPYADRDNMNMDLEMNVAANRLLWRGLGEGKATDGQPRWCTIGRHPLQRSASPTAHVSVELQLTK